MAKSLILIPLKKSGDNRQFKTIPFKLLPMTHDGIEFVVFILKERNICQGKVNIHIFGEINFVNLRQCKLTLLIICHVIDFYV